MDAFRLGAPFEIWGHWWLPGAAEQRVVGRLRCLLGHLELKLLGSFSGQDVNDRRLVVPVIHGVADARPFTLWRALQDSPSFRLPGGIEQTFHRLRVVAGEHLPLESECLFIGVALDARHIGPWMGKDPVVQGPTLQNDGAMRLEVDRDERRTFGPTSGGVTYSFGTNVRTRQEAFSSYGFDVTPTVHIDFAEPVSSARAIERVEHTIDLLSMLVGEDVGPDAIRLRPPNSRSGLDFLYEARPPIDSKLISKNEVLAPLPRLGDNVLAILEKWDTARGVMGDCVKLLRDVLDRDAPPSHVRMLLLAQALEAFHRNVCGGAYLPPDEYDQVRKVIENAIPSDLKGDLRQSLESRLKFGNDLSLRTRIRKLLDEVSDESLAPLRIEKKSFVKDVVDARNDFTHWVQTREQGRSQGAPLANLLSSLLALTQLIVLRHLGVDEGLVVNQMLESPWRYLPRYESIAEPPKSSPD